MLSPRLMSSTIPDPIINQAIHLFSEHGYAATSIAKIEAATGLTPGAGGLYHHFQSKDSSEGEAIAAVGLGSLFSSRLLRDVLVSRHKSTTRRSSTPGSPS